MKASGQRPGAFIVLRQQVLLGSMVLVTMISPVQVVMAVMALSSARRTQ